MERGRAEKKSLIETNGVAVSEDLTAVIAGGFGFGFDVVFFIVIIFYRPSVLRTSHTARDKPSAAAPPAVVYFNFRHDFRFCFLFSPRLDSRDVRIRYGPKSIAFHNVF